MDNVELRPIPNDATRKSFTHDGQDPWATDNVSDQFRYADDGDEENLITSGNSKRGLTPATPEFSQGHARSTSKQAFLQDDGGSVFSKDTEKALPWYKRLRGWRFGAANCTTAVISVFLVNLSLALWMATAKGYVDGRGIIYEGNCEQVRRTNVGLHLAINSLSTILLSASNYCMQCFSAPTRKELDRAHARNQYLEIGVMSFSNVFYISWKRSVLWLLLASSSLPLHLFFNSVAYASTSANDYIIIEVNEAFITVPDAKNITIFNNTNVRYDYNYASLVHSLYEQHPGSNSSAFTHLENADCIRAYATDYLSDHSNLLLVTANQNASSPPTTNNAQNNTFNDNTSGGPSGCVPDPYPWICPASGCRNPCTSHWESQIGNASAWAPFGNTVKYCVAQVAQPHCKIEFSQTIIIIVICFNVMKAVIMAYLVLMKDQPLVTVGDAIASFTAHPDPTTRNMCLWTKFDTSTRKYNPARPPMAKQYHKERNFRFAATTLGRLLTFGFSYVLAMGLCIFFLVYGNSQIPGTPDLNTIFGLGLGAVDARTIIHWSIPGDNLVANVLIANLAQPVLSMIYFTYNSIWTSMALGREWNRFGFRRAGLRVSGRPRGAQRMTYFLQLPYRYALPVMLLSGVLHWLVSQSIFLVAIIRYDRFGKPNLMGSGTRNGVYYSASSERAKQPAGEFLSCGYSPVAILSTIMLGVAMLGVLLVQGFRRFAPGIPLAGTSSGAISAACHAPEDEDLAKAIYRPMAWGVTGRWGEIGHCTFSSNMVEECNENNLYMGHGAKEKRE